MGAALFAACSDNPGLTEPEAVQTLPVLSIDAGAACVGATIPAAECQALVTLYNTTDGPNWLDDSGWGVDPDPRQWSGITCTGDGSSVAGINLRLNGLAGSIPAELEHLTGLRALDLGFNALAGAIPAGLGNLGDLRVLAANNNVLTGSIPSTFGNLNELNSLLLHNNKLSGLPASLANLTTLEGLYLANNSFSGPIPGWFGDMVGLQHLWLFANEFDGSIPPELGNLTGLAVLLLQLNELSGPIPPELGNMAGLLQLELFNNNLTGSIPEELTQLSSLHAIDLLDNLLSGQVSVGVAAFGEALIACRFGLNAGLFIPDTQAYRDVDLDGNGVICNLQFSSAEDVGGDAVEDIDELVPDVLNEGQANALKSKIENAMAKAANGQYGAAINQMQAFLSQLDEMIDSGTLTAEQAEPFIAQAQAMIEMWTELL
jgi:hypothetical protein